MEGVQPRSCITARSKDSPGNVLEGILEFQESRGGAARREIGLTVWTRENKA